MGSQAVIVGAFRACRALWRRGMGRRLIEESIHRPGRPALRHCGAGSPALELTPVDGQGPAGPGLSTRDVLGQPYWRFGARSSTGSWGATLVRSRAVVPPAGRWD